MQTPRDTSEPSYDIEPSSRTLLCTETNFLEHLYADMDSCSKSIKIVSPFLNTKAIDRLSARLKHLHQRNAQIIVYTRPPTEEDWRFEGAQAKDLLRQIGLIH